MRNGNGALGGEPGTTIMTAGSFQTLSFFLQRRTEPTGEKQSQMHMEQAPEVLPQHKICTPSHRFECLEQYQRIERFPAIMSRWTIKVFTSGHTRGRSLGSKNEASFPRLVLKRFEDPDHRASLKASSLVARSKEPSINADRQNVRGIAYSRFQTARFSRC